MLRAITLMEIVIETLHTAEIKKRPALANIQMHLLHKWVRLSWQPVTITGQRKREKNRQTDREGKSECERVRPGRMDSE